MPQAIRLRKGRRFGILRVEGESPRASAKERLFYVCRCKCGGECRVQAKDLLRGNNRSCGCQGRKQGGESYSQEYYLWQSMMSRCYRKNQKSYRDYGAKGVRVCERWHTFADFLADVGRRPSPEHTIDRIEVEGHYEPGNVRWATRTEQMRNTRRNRVIEHNGERKTLAEWSESSGVPYGRLQWRVSRGWPFAVALRPEKHRGSKHYTTRGRTP